MQWNRLTASPDATGEADDPVPEADPVPMAHEPALLRGLGERPWVYFVHSFAPPVGPETVAVCDYGGPVAALAARGSLWGAQFHPEKSGATGLGLLANFVALVG